MTDLDAKGLEAAAIALHGSVVFQPAYGPWEGNRRVSEKHAEQGAEAAIRAYLSAVLPPCDGVEVKALEWSDYSDEDGFHIEARTVVAVYTVRGCHLEINGQFAKTFITPDAAKSAAQSDYSRRIRSALTAVPETEQEKTVRLLTAAMRAAPDASTAVPVAGEAVASEHAGSIYIASKVKHAERWRKIAELYPVSSSWIYEAGEGETSDYDDLWRRCVAEASGSRAIVVYREPDESLKGAWIELGAALHAGVPVHAVGLEEFTVGKSKSITHHGTMKEAVTAALAEPVRSFASPVPAAVDTGKLAMPTDQDWYQRKAALEEEHEIGAGRRTTTVNLTEDDIAAYERLAFEALPKWAQNEITRLRALSSPALSIDGETEAAREAVELLRGLERAVANMRVPQTLEEAAMQISITIGPAFLAARSWLSSHSPNPTEAKEG